MQDSQTEQKTTIKREPIADLLFKVGKILLRGELHTEFMPIGKVARVAQKYKIRSAVNSFRTSRLQELVTLHFDRYRRMVGAGVRVAYRTERKGKNLETQLAFHEYDPANDGPAEEGIA